MDKKHYLMLKQHTKTGLKYLCYHFGTKDSCFTYKGSGLYWTSHLKKHGKNISTIILKESEDKKIISEEGIKYSDLWDIVNSKEFANLIIENAESDSTKIHTKEARDNRVKSFKNRIENYGLTEKELNAKRKAIKIMHSDENRKKAKISIRKRFEIGNLTDKQKNIGLKRKERILNFGFTEKELKYHTRISKFQLNKSMPERLNDPNWINPNKGKTGKEIYGADYVHPRQGKKLKDTKGLNYIEPKSKPFKITVDNTSEYFTSESDFIDKTKLTSPMLGKLRKHGHHMIKRLSNSIHKYPNGAILFYEAITIEEYKTMFVG
jgi:hypothetical protein